jgi:hypothetical protein
MKNVVFHPLAEQELLDAATYGSIVQSMQS